MRHYHECRETRENVTYEGVLFTKPVGGLCSAKRPRPPCGVPQGFCLPHLAGRVCARSGVEQNDENGESKESCDSSGVPRNMICNTIDSGWSTGACRSVLDCPTYSDYKLTFCLPLQSDHISVLTSPKTRSPLSRLFLQCH